MPGGASFHLAQGEALYYCEAIPRAPVSGAVWCLAEGGGLEWCPAAGFSRSEHLCEARHIDRHTQGGSVEQVDTLLKVGPLFFHSQTQGYIDEGRT